MSTTQKCAVWGVVSATVTVAVCLYVVGPAPAWWVYPLAWVFVCSSVYKHAVDREAKANLADMNDHR